MKTFQYTCVTIEDFCKYAGWDYNETMDALNSSQVSWGTNDDTLVSVSRLCYIVGKKVDFEDILVSLGA